jgi:Asp-tRNA(Asn)/Glu-tRNA(Gln) amidotransferase A subunit family amidase
MDKPGPMCRTVEDCAVVLDAIHGPDGHDRTLRDVPYGWDPRRPLDDLRVGYLREAFEATAEQEGEEEEGDRAATIAAARSALDTLRGLGVDPEPVGLPDRYPVEGMSFMPFLEAAAAFDEFSRSGLDDQMREQGEGSWANLFRRGQLMPAVEYIRANRIRTMLMGAMRELFEEVDLFVAPTDAGQLSNVTNLTGHPALCVPSGFEEDGTPVSVTFVGDLYREAEVARVAHAFQASTDFHGRQPPEFSV